MDTNAERFHFFAKYGKHGEHPKTILFCGNAYYDLIISSKKEKPANDTGSKDGSLSGQKH